MISQETNESLGAAYRPIYCATISSNESERCVDMHDYFNPNTGKPSYVRSVYERRKRAADKPAPPIELIDTADALLAFMQEQGLIDASYLVRMRIYKRIANALIDGDRDIRIHESSIPMHGKPNLSDAAGIGGGIEFNLREMQGRWAYGSPVYQRVMTVYIVISFITALVLYIMISMGIVSE